MIKISSKEAEFIRSKKLGYLVHISSPTHKSRSKRYYLTEDPRALRLLNAYRKESVIYSYGSTTRKKK
jgi:hypothetical protein